MAWPLIVSEGLKGAAVLAGNASLAIAMDKYLNSSNPRATQLQQDYPSVGIPTKRTKISSTSLKDRKRQSLKDTVASYADKWGAGLVAGAGVAATLYTSSNNQLGADVSKNEALKASVPPEAKLLKFQIEHKESVDNLVAAINAQTATGIKLFGNLDGSLGALTASVLMVNETLLEISDNYSQELNNTNDLPYVDGDTYYRMLSESGMPDADIKKYRDLEDSYINSMMSSSVPYSEIKDAVRLFRSANIPNTFNLKAESQLSGITKASPVSQTTGQPVSSVSPSPVEFPDFQPLFDWAISAKNVSDYMQTPVQIGDLDGNLVAEMAPMHAKTIKAASDARYKTDINNEQYDDTDLPSFEPFPWMPFFGISKSYDEKIEISQPFMPNLSGV